MKKKPYPREKTDLASLKTDQSRKLLKHILSPLDAAAFEHAYRPFTYTLEKGVSIYVSQLTIKQLKKSTGEKLDLLIACIHRMEYNVPAKYRDAFEDPKIILSLHPTLRNRLCKLNCYTLFAILLRGKTYFEAHHFSKSNLQTLHALFVKYDCGDLF